MRTLAAVSLVGLSLAACESSDKHRTNALAHCNAETLKFYPDSSRVPDEHVFRANCMRAQGYVLQQGEQRCNGMLSAQREASCYQRVN
ncbi:MAG: hypothetical protein SGI91_22220 [Alphaproteobacteria bacterium]|nr:hypothetical protein [Alphaproteobacteria bacterium]